MVCYICSGNTQVLNSRPQKRLNQVWRRRNCTLCDTLFTTNEAIDHRSTLLVPIADGRSYQPFERDRLFISLYKSLGHHPQALREAGELCATAIVKLVASAQNGVISRQQIAHICVVVLQRFDKLAAQHYAAMHRL